MNVRNAFDSSSRFQGDRMRHRRRMVASQAALLIGWLLSPHASTPARAATVWSVDGASAACNNAGPGNAENPFCTIQAAAKRATAGDTVRVRPGDYREQVTPHN